MTLCLYYFIILITIQTMSSIENPGRLNVNYEIKDYYGSRVKDSYMTNSFIKDQPVIINWSNGKFLEHTARKFLWLADKNEHTIKMLTTDCKYIL